MSYRTAAVLPISLALLSACATAPGTQVIDSLYFGLSIPGGGTVSEEQWAQFVDGVVTPRFPSGFTVLTGKGQWRSEDGSIDVESTRLLQIVHAGDSRSSRAIEEIRALYKERFHQEAVLRITTRGAVSF